MLHPSLLLLPQIKPNQALNRPELSLISGLLPGGGEGDPKQESTIPKTLFPELKLKPMIPKVLAIRASKHVTWCSDALIHDDWKLYLMVISTDSDSRRKLYILSAAWLRHDSLHCKCLSTESLPYAHIKCLKH